MKIGIPKEHDPKEPRVILTPAVADKLVKLGADVLMESGAGLGSGFSDADYEKSGVKIAGRVDTLTADIVARIRKPDIGEVSALREGAIHISLMDPFHSAELIKSFETNKTTAISLELIPRTTKAQKMDVLSSQANLAGYVAVILAAERMNKIFPMMMTPSGTISPARVFVIGAGVAGLQAIATAKRLGARVDAFDTRPAVAEQIQSLGAKVVKVDLGETGQTKDGYAKALTDEQLAKQRDAMAKQCALSDVVITTAQVFGKKAPLIITKAMVEGMKPGSIIVDLAVETGGNTEGIKADEEVVVNGVRLMGLFNLPGRVAANASDMLANNLYSLLQEFWNKETKSFDLRMDDEILKGCVVTHQGRMINAALATK